MANYSTDQLFAPEVILGVSKTFVDGPNYIQSLLGMGVGGTPTAIFPGHTGTVDRLDGNRAVGGISVRDGVPRRVQPKVVGTDTLTCYKYYESVVINANKLYPLRAIGGASNVVDPSGQSHYKEQIKYLSSRRSNLREFTVSRTLLGQGFALKAQNDNEQQIIPVEFGAGDQDVATGMPVANTGQLPLGTAGADLISAVWSNANTDIAAQVSNVNEAMLLKTGIPLRHVMISTTIWNYLRKNTLLQNEGGSVVRPWEEFSNNPAPQSTGKQNAGFTVEFRAIPNVMFHVVDAFLMLEDSNQVQSDQRDRSKLTKVIPDDKAIFLPDPNPEWIGWAAGTEMVKKNITSIASDMVNGADAWSLPLNDPPGFEVRMIDIGLPYLRMKDAVMSATVTGF